MEKIEEQIQEQISILQGNIGHLKKQQKELEDLSTQVTEQKNTLEVSNTKIDTIDTLLHKINLKVNDIESALGLNTARIEQLSTTLEEEEKSNNNDKLDFIITQYDVLNTQLNVLESAQASLTKNAEINSSRIANLYERKSDKNNEILKKLKTIEQSFLTDHQPKIELNAATLEKLNLKLTELEAKNQQLTKRQNEYIIALIIALFLILGFIATAFSLSMFSW